MKFEVCENIVLEIIVFIIFKTPLVKTFKIAFVPGILLLKIPKAKVTLTFSQFNRLNIWLFCIRVLLKITVGIGLTGSKNEKK